MKQLLNTTKVSLMKHENKQTNITESVRGEMYKIN